MRLEEIQKLIESTFSEAVVGVSENTTPVTLEIKPEFLLRVCELLHANEKTYFDLLSCITGIDNGEDSGSMEVLYHLYSIPYDIHLALKVTLDREDPEVDSVCDIWKTADWHEREAFDLLGIKFKNHPDLRRILLPADWEGYPLRKDYVEQERYHEVPVKWEGRE